MNDLEKEVKKLNYAFKSYKCNMLCEFVITKKGVSVYVLHGNKPVASQVGDTVKDVMSRMPEFKKECLKLCTDVKKKEA